MAEYDEPTPGTAEWHAKQAAMWLDGELSHWNRVAGHAWSEAVCVLADVTTAQTHATLALALATSTGEDR